VLNLQQQQQQQQQQQCNVSNCKPSPGLMMLIVQVPQPAPTADHISTIFLAQMHRVFQQALAELLWDPQLNQS
jgi:hypothetical protein